MTEAKVLSLKNLLVPSKSAKVDYPGLEGFVVHLKYLTRDALIKLREKATTQRFKPGSRVAEEDLDQELFLKLYAQAAIAGWDGLKVKYLLNLAPADLGGVDEEDFVGYSEENAYFLMRNSNSFDSWVSATVGDLSKFQ